MNDTELLALLGEERKASVGFGSDNAELTDDREKALNYFKGEMPDVKSLANRSAAVSSDVADAIYTVLPDLMEIFTGGDDPATFSPVGEEDEQAAKQETDYINHVVFRENDGFMVLLTGFQDALLTKTGIFKWWWERATEEETFDGKDAMEFAFAAQAAEQAGDEITDLKTESGAEPLAALDLPGEVFNFTIKRKTGGAKIGAWAPEDFTIAADASNIPDATYSAGRSRVRIQQLLADGYDKAKVLSLPAYGAAKDSEEETARDTAGESEKRVSTSYDGLRQVEIIEHFIKLDMGDGLCTYRVVTGGGETILLDKKKVSAPQCSAITPYPQTHRFYGRSLADLLLEVQRIKTALLRMLLDSGYFALNQRNEVNMDRANQWTIADLLRNEPGVPVRSKGEAVKPIASGSLNFDVMGALEYVATLSESRTGVVRNAQGLNPDTLHDTARGAQALVAAAQKRIRMIARVFAETGVKDLFLGVHALIRENATKAQKVRLRNEWVDIDPSSWGARKDMEIEIGVGSGGREHDIIAGNQLIGLQAQAVQAQGGLEGPLVNVEAIRRAALRQTERLGYKNGEQYWTDPKTYQAPPPQKDPAVAEAEGKLALEEKKAQGNLQLEQAKAQSGLQIEQARTEGDAEIARYRADLEVQVRREIAAGELALKREQLSAELMLKRELAMEEMALKREQMALNAQRADMETSPDISNVNMGGEAG